MSNRPTKRPLPVGWEAKSLSEVVSRVTRRNDIRNGNVLTISAREGLVNQEEYFNRRIASIELSPYFLLERGDFAYNKSYSAGFPVGVIRRLDRYPQGVVSPLYICFRPSSRHVWSDYLAHYFQSGLLDDDIAWIAKEGARNHGLLNVSVGDLFSVPMHVPPMSEQVKIAEILDVADEAIRSAEQLVAKLEKVEQGLLHDLLTRAVTNADRVSPLGEVSVIAGGVTLGRSISGSGTVELPYLRVANVQDGFIDTREMKTVRILRTELDRYRLRSGDVLMTEGGDFDKLGRGAVWDGSIDPCLHQNHVFRVRCDPSILLPEFLTMYSASPAGRCHFVLMSKQTTNLASINMTQLKAFPVPIPSLQEQSRIVTVANAQKDEIRGESAMLRKLRLLKRGLLDDLLTGRMRVGASV